MPKTLKEEVADRKTQESVLKRTPEIDARLDQFIAENSKLRDYYEGFSKDELIRKLMLGKMKRAGHRADRNEELRAWVEENPDVKARVEERVRNVPLSYRERAFINAAKTEAQNRTVRQGNGVRP